MPDTIEQQLDDGLASAEQREEAGQGTFAEAFEENPPAEIRPHIGMPKIETEIAAPAVVEQKPAERFDNTGVADVTPLTMLASALNSGHDVTKLERLFDLAERHEANEARKAFAAALSDFQAEVPAIVESKLATVTMKGGGAYTYSYADLDIIMKTIRPLLGRHGLSVRYDAETSDDGQRIRSTCYVMHRGGHQETTTFVVPVDEAMKVNDSQKMGSANSYACRYNVVNALGLTTGEDNDAQSLHGAKSESRSAQPATQANDDLFPFGKHKGEPWDSVPLDYLEWVAGNANEEAHRVRARQQIEDRGSSQEEPERDPGELTMAECARQITEAKTHAALVELWKLVPDRHREGLVNWYEARKRELATD